MLSRKKLIDDIVRIFNLYHEGNSYQTISNGVSIDIRTRNFTQSGIIITT